MPSKIPAPRTLTEAVIEVVQQNISMGYRPIRFINATGEGYAPNLFEVCVGLIHSPDAIGAMLDAVPQYPGLLTLEDRVINSEHGREWGFDPATIEQAEASVELFDQLSGSQRWSRR